MVLGGVGIDEKWDKGGKVGVGVEKGGSWGGRIGGLRWTKCGVSGR